MAKENNKNNNNRISLTGYDPVESPENVIAADKNSERKKAFSETYKRVMQIIPEYFLTHKNKRNGSSGTSGGNSFTQNIVVTQENVKIETSGLEEKEVLDRQNEKER